MFWRIIDINEENLHLVSLTKNKRKKRKKAEKTKRKKKKTNAIRAKF